MKKIYSTLFFVIVVLILAVGAWALNGGDIKWRQPPDMQFGVNIKSTEPEPLVADDWRCEDPRPVTDVHFWGSYIGWERSNPNPPLPPPGVDGFMIRIYSDVPAGVDQTYSHPGELLYEKGIDVFEERYEASIPHPEGSFEHKFYYSLDLPEPFEQIEGTIYWISIAAIMPNGSDFPWGWETSTRHWNDNATRFWVFNNYWEEITPSMLPSWYQEHYTTVDMAFELTVGFEPPPPLEPIKWQQRPDMVQGVNIISIPDIPSTDPGTTVADDWLCLDGSPVSDLHFWGSYPGWMVNEPDPPGSPPGVRSFRIQIYSDVPAAPPERFSRPGKLLYEAWVNNFSETYVASIPLPWEEIEHKFRYDLDLPRIFWQQRNQIYWLNISAIPLEPQYPWGWESSMDRWNDYAVQGWYVDPDNWLWDLIFHPWTREPLDVSYELTTCEGPIKWLQFPDMADGLNIVSRPMDPVVADDWLCTNGKPITEVHFWGSYLSPDGQPHWEQSNPGPPGNPLPQTPGVQAFKLSVHRDVPAGVDPNMPWSHPGELLYEVSIDFARILERYWDSVPHTNPAGEIWWEHKFYYITRLEEPFLQEEGTIYWLDIGAIPRPGIPWVWGWETSKDHWNDNAVAGFEGGSFWRDLGEIYGSPIDMAFLLITPDDTPYCEGDYDRDGDVDGTDLAKFAADFGRTNCYFSGDCEGDTDYDGDVDGTDLAKFAADFGRTNCPCTLIP